ncbi:MAG: LacI family DNA-binding transcriptional regulator [Bryobacteraceae bacterium]
MATLRQVAKRARVSVGTVSHVINGKVPVSPERRQRVQDAILALDYQPDHVARSLKTGRTRTVGIVVPDITNPFFPQIIRGAEGVFTRQHYSAITFDTDDNLERERQVLSFLRSRRVDGVLLVIAPNRGDSAHIRGVLEAGVPVVCLDRMPQGVDAVDSVTVDSVAAAKECVRHLIAMGHREIAMFTGTLTLSNARDRVKGYKAALRDAGLPLLRELIKEGDFRQETGYRLCLETFASKNRPSALFVSNALMALGALEAFAKLGLRCPDEVALACFDGFPIPEVFRPGITAVVQPAYEIGRLGAEQLLQRISDGTHAPPVHLQLATELRVRESSLRPFTNSSAALAYK